MIQPRNLELIVKGFGNHFRIKILLLLKQRPGLSLEDIVAEIGAKYPTIGAHTQRLRAAGLISTRPTNSIVQHALTPRGESVVAFIKSLK